MIILHLHVKKPSMNLHVMPSAKEAILRTIRAAQYIKIYSIVRNPAQIIITIFFDNKHSRPKSNFVKDSHASEHVNTVSPTSPSLTYAMVASNQSSHPNSTPSYQVTSPSAE
ncbi:unnamed protein product [Macrosiphum euphorbiae]|uniref:Uncharacterized protein n=1 Tax=Macrosiphum euphorbiae TaxID=13131 RepID=A0AAV0VPZ3_9HEMI|nr:unnamed protein product [Macrosiphum euphorbiae]